MNPPIKTKRIVTCPVCCGTGSQIFEDPDVSTSTSTTIPVVGNCYLCLGSGLTKETATTSYEAYWPRALKENYR